MLKNAYFLAKIGADTAENERNFAKNLQLPYGCMRMIGDEAVVLPSLKRARVVGFAQVRC